MSKRKKKKQKQQQAVSMPDQNGQQRILRRLLCLLGEVRRKYQCYIVAARMRSDDVSVYGRFDEDSKPTLKYVSITDRIPTYFEAFMV